MAAHRGIEFFAKLVPKAVLSRSGSVFYSGRLAFSSPAPFYVLGANPGGDPDDQNESVIADHIDWVLREAPNSWSSYRDQSWKGRAPGTHGMQPRMLHLFSELGVDPGRVPASNLQFVRSTREAEISSEADELADGCWQFHEAVLSELKPPMVLCLGQTAGDFVLERLGPHRPLDTFVEENRRRWTSRAFRTAKGMKVVVATHPSIANWRSAPTDPSGMIRRVLDDA